MPVTHRKSDASDMNSDTSPSCRLRAFSRGGSLESRSSSCRSRSFTLDDESLKYLTHEEKDVLLFFEETIDSLDEDFEEPVLCDGGVRCLCSPSLEESTSSPSEPEDVIDLVQPAPGAGEAEGLPEGTQAAGPAPAGKEHRKQDAETPPPPDPPAPETLPAPPPLPSTPDPSRRELRAPSPPVEHPRLLRSVPTPLVMAQKISERLAGNEALSPTSPSREGRPGEWRTPAARGPRSGDSGPGPSHPALANGFPSAHEALKSAPSSFAPAGKSLCFRPGPALPSTRARQSFPGPRQPNGAQDWRRAASLPRPQGITVQFAGRGSSEEARREALRKLGLLRESS
ncbi:PROSER2 isoform 3 [Pan troglodytes]|uniref:PROSER2 isoform 3 n=1 Tax=Pan troglodytes TaxID=9598 RepID=A0A2J8KYU9_PANTR|nr:PROSER2 isoform 3 [Pan troglodytes]